MAAGPGLLLPLGLAMVAGGLAMGATAGLRALGEARAAFVPGSSPCPPS